MSLSEYLQKKYLSRPDKRKKENKGKKDKQSKKLKINDDIIIEDNSIITLKEVDPIKENFQDFQVSEELKCQKENKKKGWKVVGTDEIIETPKGETNEPLMISGAKAGLQTAKEVSAQIHAKQEAEMEYLKLQTEGSMDVKNETVHRDSSGRKINIERLKEEEKFKKRIEEEEKEKKKILMNMGLVQKLQMEQNRAKLDRIGNSGFARYSDDAELNKKQKDKELDDDPMLSFNPSKSSKYLSLTGRKLYKGGFPENRFGITPGHRWDGVDRSNGFEKKWFKAQQERQTNKILSYTMQEDE